MEQLQPLAPMAFTIPEACKVSGVGRSKLYEAIASGALRARKNGAKNLILREDLQRWLESLPTERAAAPSPKPRVLAAAE
jgi:excisionase family DNA binding protein